MPWVKGTPNGQVRRPGHTTSEVEQISRQGRHEQVEPTGQSRSDRKRSECCLTQDKADGQEGDEQVAQLQHFGWRFRRCSRIQVKRPEATRAVALWRSRSNWLAWRRVAGSLNSDSPGRFVRRFRTRPAGARTAKPVHRRLNGLASGREKARAGRELGTFSLYQGRMTASRAYHGQSNRAHR